MRPQHLSSPVAVMWCLWLNPQRPSQWTLDHPNWQTLQFVVAVCRGAAAPGPDSSLLNQLWNCHHRRLLKYKP